MIIDAHTHRYSEEVIADPVAFAVRTGEEKWLSMVSPSDRTTLQGWADRKTMLHDMDAAGVAKCVLLGWYWERYQTCMEANDWHRTWMEQDPDRFICFLSVRPGIPDIVEYLKQAREDGFQGIGESHPWAQGFSIRDKEWIRVMEFACSHGWPVNFHVTDPSGKHYPGKTLTPMEDFLWLSKELPELKIILAHAGALYALNHPVPENFYFDLAACPLLYPPSIYQQLIDSTGPEKILWGTDYPLLIYPKTQKKPEFRTFLEEFKDSVNADNPEMEAMTGSNLCNLLP